MIVVGDAREWLKRLPSESVHCCITSPPYWGLRDYGVSGQIGLEPTWQAFVSEMVGVFREVRRVLRADGTLWLNLGDAYGSGTRTTRDYSKTTKHGYWNNPAVNQRIGAPAKQLLGIPWRVALALQEDGWYLRQDIIWAKPNPMPESVTDRCTKAHEYLFLLSKSARYYYDAEAIKEENADRYREPKEWSRHGQAKTAPIRQDGDAFHADGSNAAAFNGLGRNKRSVWQIATAPFPKAHFATFPPKLVEPCILAGTSEHGCCDHCGAPWERVTRREFVPQQDVSLAKGIKGAGNQKPMDASNGWQGFPRGTTDRQTLGWYPACDCDSAPALPPYPDKPKDNAQIEKWRSQCALIDRERQALCERIAHVRCAPATVLDPFGGAGTTALVADRLGRDYLLIELNPDYAAMAEQRIAEDRIKRAAPPPKRRGTRKTESDSVIIPTGEI